MAYYLRSSISNAYLAPGGVSLDPLDARMFFSLEAALAAAPSSEWEPIDTATVLPAPPPAPALNADDCPPNRTVEDLA